MCKKERSRRKCKAGKDFLRHAQKFGAEVRNGKGSHCVVSTPGGMCVVPVHANKQLGKGIRSKILKTFILIGLVLAIIILGGCI